MLKMIHDKPAVRFGEAYPIGNGQMGAMVYGSFPIERITLTENTFFSGKRSGHNCQPGAKEAFHRMRKLLKEECYAEAHREAEYFIGVRHDYGTNLPVGELYVRFEELSGTEKEKMSRSTDALWKTEANRDGLLYEEYERSLDYECGIAKSSAAIKGYRVCAEAFASHPDHVLIWHMESSAAGGISVELAPRDGHGEVYEDARGFAFTARALEEIHCDEPCGVTLVGVCRADTDGTVKNTVHGLRVEQATYLTLSITCDTDYRRCMEKTQLWERLTRLYEEHSYEEIRDRHVRDVYGLMRKAELQLEGEQASSAGRLFQFGRYLLLSSSREDSVLPAHLQGIWNDDVACRIGWTCDMHLDINTQMNYWPADATGLSESMAPVSRWMKRLAQAGEHNASASYGMKGWAAEIVSNSWCYEAPYWAVPISACPTGGAWLLTQLWEHYLYIGDEEYLRNTVYPLLKGAAQFFSEYVFEDEKTGYLSSGPSISPENSFLVEEKEYYLSLGCTYEMSVIREIFEEFLRAYEILYPEPFEEAALAQRIREQQRKLPPLRILADGTIAEWSHDHPAKDPQHRHTSHLLSLYPFQRITPDTEPELCKAAKKTIERKLSPYEEWEDTGWARSLLILYSARLRDGEAAWFHVRSMMESLLEPNGMIFHPPTRGTLCGDDFGHVYELDGNTGLTAGITEMLLQSRPGEIELLPALPEEWQTGSVRGLKARGNVEVSMRWECGKLKKFTLLSLREQKCRVYWKGDERTICLHPGEPFIWQNP
ncbi:MAG: glycoside hydrolase N-terminal domain-containing protein [Eubacteriales bacterium]|nr:glycoside hydrolase N-terminal domain-containing protein [Eubacteriales bacterium]